EATELGGRECEIAVLFVDIRGFTTMSEKLEPARVVEILNEYLTLTTDCVFKNHGTLDKFVGDCTMAFWGAPLPQEDCIFKAVKAGFDMIEGAKSLSQELKERYGETVDFGVGVNFGKAVVGNIGAKNRMDYTAIGDTVNTAARLEANAPGGKIYVSRAVADALQGRVRFESLGDTIQLKGKAAGFEILSAVELLDKGE
ncbi:MAG: adenylate/guanylate cyclase domain-containing protein, partial [Lachnospiraceae bacterium]|nr:adenylate/guanylate cyclase domain-containing protein [Lachnospiraceae bacterium]